MQIHAAINGAYPNQTNIESIAMASNILTQSILKELLSYSPDTGVFTWMITVPPVLAGSVAGGISNKGYCRIGIKGKKYSSHRLAYLYMTGEFPPDQIDHINGVRHDNRWVNIRAATPIENGQNQKIQFRNTSGAVGVTWHEPAKKWRSMITVNNHQIYLGYFDRKEDAISARKSAELKHGFHPNHGRR